MTLATTTTRNDYAGSDSVGPFSFTFKIFDATHLEVTTRDADGVETTLSYPTDYTVTGVGDSTGGSVTLGTALATGEHLTIRRVMPLTQTTDLRNQGGFLPSSNEDALDVLAMGTQGLREEVERSIRLGPTLDPDDYTLTLGAPESGMVLGATDTGVAWVPQPTLDLTLPADGRTTGTLTQYLAHNATFNVQDYGAAGDGTADDTAEIQATITAAGAAGGTVLFPTGVYRITSGLTGASDVDLVFDAAAEIRVDAGANFTVLALASVSRVRLRGLRITRNGSSALGTSSRGVVVSGTSTDLTFERVRVEAGFALGIDVGNGGTTDLGGVRPITHVRLVECYVEGTSSLFGYNVDDAEDVTFDDCTAYQCFLDGLKVRKNTKYVRVIGGSYRENGQSWAQPVGTPGRSTGDGIDAYSGGDSLIIDNPNCSDNLGNGYTIKTDSIQQDATLGPAFGTPSRCQVIGGTFVGNDPGYGGAFYVFGTADLTMPIPHTLVVTGGLYELNAGYGLYLNAMNAKVFGAQCHRNTLHGIFVEKRALDVELHGCSAFANGYPTAPNPAVYNVFIDGKRVRVFGGTYRGVYPDGITQESDLAGLTVYSNANIVVGANADHVEVHSPDGGQTTVARLTTVEPGCTGNILVDMAGDGNPTGVGGQHGSAGSRWRNRTAVNDYDVMWVKRAGSLPDSPNTWRRTIPLKSSGSVGVAQTAIAHGLSYTPTAIAIVPKANAIVWQSAVPDATNVYLTASVAATGVDVYAI